jgi:hypothetical protein
MTNAQRIYAQTCRHLQAVQANIDRLAELNANEELALLTGRLQRLALRLQELSFRAGGTSGAPAMADIADKMAATRTESK